MGLTTSAQLFLLLSRYPIFPFSRLPAHSIVSFSIFCSTPVTRRPDALYPSLATSPRGHTNKSRQGMRTRVESTSGTKRPSSLPLCGASIWSCLRCHRLVGGWVKRASRKPRRGPSERYTTPRRTSLQRVASFQPWCGDTQRLLCLPCVYNPHIVASTSLWVCTPFGCVLLCHFLFIFLGLIACCMVVVKKKINPLCFPASCSIYIYIEYKSGKRM